MDNHSVDETYRNICKTALRSVLSIEKNIDILERNIFQSTTTLDEYEELTMSIVTKIRDGHRLNPLLKTIKEKKIGYKSDYFKDVRDTLDEQQNFIENPFEVDEGVLECSKCGSKKTFSFSKQTRGGDEGTTVFAQCTNCGKKWIT
jgi:DNA-directed RNA polymerase subunit M/transcription elongation factor TFIIS